MHTTHAVIEIDPILAPLQDEVTDPNGEGPPDTDPGPPNG
jgi:hypothetical protein